MHFSVATPWPTHAKTLVFVRSYAIDAVSAKCIKVGLQLRYTCVTVAMRAQGCVVFGGTVASNLG